MASKSDIVDHVREKTGLTKKQAEDAFDSVIEAFTKTFSKGEGVTILNFGSFTVKDVPAAVRRNPRTGEPINVPAGKSLKFKVSDNLKALVNKS